MKVKFINLMLIVGAVLLGMVACEREFESTKSVESLSEVGYVSDSIKQVPVSKLPDKFTSFLNEEVFVSNGMIQKDGSESLPIHDFLEPEAMSVLSEKGITTYSVAIKEGISLNNILKNELVKEALKMQDDECRKTVVGFSDAVYPNYNVIVFNQNADGEGGAVNLVHFVNHGANIQTTFVNLNTGVSSTYWTPNTYSTTFSGTNSGSSWGSGAGNFFNGIWTGIRNIGNAIGRFFSNLFRVKPCGCGWKNKPAIYSKQGEGDLDNSCDCDDENDDNRVALAQDFSIPLPDAFFERTKEAENIEIDCECQYDKMIGNTDQHSEGEATAENITYFDCSCQKNETGGVAMLLGLTEAEKQFLETDEGKKLNAEICKFVKDNKYSKQAVSFAKEVVAEAVKYHLDFKSAYSMVVINKTLNPITGKPIEFYLLLKYKNPEYFNISKFSIGGESFKVGDYTLTPHYSPNEKLVFYTAARYSAKGGLVNDIEYVIKPEGLEDFKDKIDLYTAAANLFYLNGIPSNGQIALAAEDYFTGLKEMWGDALTDPQYYVYLAHVFVGVATNLNAVNSTSTTYAERISFTSQTGASSEVSIVINNRSALQFKQLIQTKFPNGHWIQHPSGRVEIFEYGNVRYVGRTINKSNYKYTIDYYRNGVRNGKFRFNY